MFTSYVMLMAQRAAEHPQMTTAGWVFLIAAWAVIILVTVWTFSKILRGK